MLNTIFYQSYYSFIKDNDYVNMTLVLLVCVFITMLSLSFVAMQLLFFFFLFCFFETVSMYPVWLETLDQIDLELRDSSASAPQLLMTKSAPSFSGGFCF